MTLLLIAIGSFVSVGANNTDCVTDNIYTVDKKIPSYLIPSSTQDSERIINKINSAKGDRNILEILLSLNEKTTAVLSDTLTDLAGGYHESYKEYYNGIEVEGTRCTIHYDKDGNITSINGNFRTISNLNTVPSINESAALQIALTDVGAEKYAWEDQIREQMVKTIKKDPNATCYPKGKLVVYATSNNISLAYKFNIESLVPRSSLYIYVNAENGDILGKNDADCEISATTSVATVHSGQRTITTDYSNGSYRLRDYTRGSGIITLDSLSLDDYYSTNNTWSDMSDVDRIALDAHWGVETTYDYYYNKFGRNSYDNNGAQLISYVNKEWYPNAKWNQTLHIFVFGLDFEYNPYVDLDVVSHEYTHAVTESTSHLTYQGESGAIDEGLSDAMAVCVENEAKPNNGQLIWVIGENIRTGGIRDMRNPACKFYNGTGWQSITGSDHGGVHTNSGVFNYWFYLLVTGGNGTNEAGINYNVVGIGLDKAISICYLMNTAYLTSNSNFYDACSCSYLAAEQLGYTDDIGQIKNAWIAVGVDFPSEISISGPSVLCGTTNYTLTNVPSGYSVNWNVSGLNASNFAATSSGNYCSIVPLVSNTYQTALLNANVTYNSQVVRTITKKIYTHDSYLYVEGFQDEFYDGEYYYPEQYFNYSAINATNGYSSSQILINSECDIELTSSRFKGMNISFEGDYLPTNVSRNDSCVFFHTQPISLSPVHPRERGIGDIIPPTPTYYTLTMNVYSPNGCYDFDLNFVVSNIYDHDANLVVSTSGNTLYAHLMSAVSWPIGGGTYQQPTWNLSIINAQNGQTVYSTVVTGSSTSVNISSLSSGLYIVRAVYNGNTYSNKFIK